jgi:uncharacterized protein YceK
MMMMVGGIRVRQRAYLFGVFLIFFIVILITSGCGDGSSNDSERQSLQTSSASLKIRWHDTPYHQNSKIVDLAAALDCQSSGVESVVCQVYNLSGNQLATGGPWPCITGRGRVDGIPAGSDRTFVVLAEDANGDIRYHGQTLGVTIYAGEITESVVVDTYLFIPNLIDPEDGSQLDPNSFSLEWENLENAGEYIVQVAEDMEFQSIIIDESIGGEIYVPSTLSPSTTYFWRILAVDTFANIGAASQVRSFMTTSCTYAISSSGNSFEQEGGSGSFDVISSSPGCEWRAAVSASWITITEGVTGSGDGRVSYTIAANPLSSERTGIVTVGGQEHVITQTGLECAYRISSSRTEFTSEGGSGGFQVISSVSDCEWAVSANVPWVEITSGARGRGSDTVSYQIESYSGTSVRNANIIVAGETHRIIQNPPLPQTCTYAITPAERNVSSAGESYTVIVDASREDCSWGASSNVEWVLVSPTTGTGDGDVNVTVRANLGESRSANITIAGNLHAVSQDSGDVRPTLILPENGEENMDNGCLDRTDLQEWYFDWSDVPGAVRYHIYVIGQNASYPVIDTIVTSSNYYNGCTGCYIIESNRFNWSWRVRAGDANSWSEWSDTFNFDVEPLNSDCSAYD